MHRRRWMGPLAAVVVMAASACGSRELSPEEARKKGDAMLAEMSNALASTSAFSYTAEQEIEPVGRGGAKTVDRFTRKTVISRPNRLAFADEGNGHATTAWYDGSHVTIVSANDKVWARGPMPGTLDEALDFVSAEYAIQIPTADLLYSKPIDALIDPDTTGGWVGVETITGRRCEHLSYKDSVVDWQIWLNADNRHLPCQFAITYKTVEGKPTARIVFRDFNQTPALTDTTFQQTVPEGFTRIRLMRYATSLDQAGDTAGAQQ